jgi:hypothetical protein
MDLLDAGGMDRGGESESQGERGCLHRVLRPWRDTLERAVRFRQNAAALEE